MTLLPSRRLFIGLTTAFVITLSGIPAQAQLMSEKSSIRAMGLGNMGVTLVDAMSHRVNPASLAMYAGPKQSLLTVAPYSGSNKFLADFKHTSFGAALSMGGGDERRQGGFASGVGYWYAQMDRGRFTRTSDLGEVLGVLGPKQFSHNLALSTAYDGKIKIGVGTVLKYLHDELVGYSDGLYKATSFGFDLGLLVSYPILPAGTDLVAQPIDGWSFIPSFGLTRENIAADFEFDPGHPSPDGDRPVKTTRIGGSFEITNDIRGRRNISLLLTAESEKQNWNDRTDITITHYGGELEFYNLLSARYGRLKYDEAEDHQEAYGFSLSTRGIGNLMTEHGGNYARTSPKGWWHKVWFEVSFAKFADDGPTWWERAAFYQASLTIAL